jgi:hypothetical protein
VPPRARDVARVLEHDYRITVEKSRGGSSHWMLVRGSTKYALPMPNGLKSELPSWALRGICRAFGIDEHELRSKL